MACATAWFIGSVAYQHFGWVVKQDTPARDLVDYMVGMIPAMLLTLAITNAL